MSFTGKLLKISAVAIVAGVAIKIGTDKYRQKKKEYARIEEKSKNDLIRKYTAFFDRKLVEIEDGSFEGCDIKSLGSKLVIDLSRAVIEKDVYISVDLKATSLTVILPSGQSVRSDINNIFTKVTDNTDSAESEHTIYIVGKARGCNVEIASDSVFMDDDIKEEYEDFNEIVGGFDNTAEE